MNDYTPTHYNESTILEFIIQNAETSRSKLAKSTNLIKSPISDIIRISIEKSLACELNIGMVSVSGSRKPIYLSFNNECAFVIMIEIGKDYTRSSSLYINGELVSKSSYHSLLVTKDTLIMLLTKIISDLTSKVPQTLYGILGIGMATHGIVKDNMVLSTPYSDIDSIPLGDLLAKEILYPIVLINETNAGAFREYTFKTLSEDLVNISIQDGTGVGTVENGKLFIGANSTIGEIGRITFYPDGILCPCGNHGCLEHYVSIRILLKKLLDSDHRPYPDISVIVREWRQGDAHTQKILKHNAKPLSIGINNIALMYDPEVVTINSEIYRGIPELIDETKKHLIGKNTKNLAIKNISLKGSPTFYDYASIAAQSFLKINNLKLTV